MTLLDLARNTAPDLDLSALRPVGLDGVVENAALLRRVDRKYFVPAGVAQDLVAELADTHGVLQIAGRRSTTYRSTYFDSPDHGATRAHIQRRRRRWKIRQRWYVEDDLCRVEVKTKNGRGETVKNVADSDTARYGALDFRDGAFVSNVLTADHPELDVRDLVSAAELRYTRVTLADLEQGTRVTFDHDLTATLPGGIARMDDEFVLVETKGGAVPSQADRVLTRLGVRRRSFSKYVATSSLICPDIPDNDVRALSGTVLHVHHHPTEGVS